MGLFNLFTRKKNIKNENGLNTSYWCGDGYKEYEYYKKNGKHHGKWYEFYENGVIKKEAEYFEDEIQGKLVEYFKSGRKWKETYSKNSNGSKGIITKIFYYRNGVKAREEQMKNDKIYGDIIEYNKDGTLKFKYNDGTYLFFNSEGQKAFSINNEQDMFSPIGTWQNFRSDGTLQYELEFDKANSKKQLVEKTIYTINGDVFSTTKLSYNIIHESWYKFLSKYADDRVTSKEEIIIRGIIMQGSPGFSGLANNTYIKNTPIKSIEDIIELTPIKDPENE